MCYKKNFVIMCKTRSCTNMYENFSDTKCKTWIYDKKQQKFLSSSMCKRKNCFIWTKFSKTINSQKIASSKYMISTCKKHVI